MVKSIHRVKTWLLRKTHTLLGSSGLRSQLAQISEDLRSAQAAHAEHQRVAADRLQAVCRSIEESAQNMASAAAALNLASQRLAAAPAAGTGDLEQRTTAVLGSSSWRSLEAQGLFILGAARSGTTILTRSLNRAREILLLEEPGFFQSPQVTNFVSYFNELHVSMSNRPMKGTYLAPPALPEVGPVATLERLGRDYRYIGEKEAIGPHDYPHGWQQNYLDFHSKYFLRGHYIYILRTPVESLWSMHKMFPHRPVERLFEAWLRAVALSLDAYHVFPNSRVVFFDDLGPAMIERLGEWLDLSIPCPPGTFGRNYMESAVQDGVIPEVLRPFAGLCGECTELYRDLRDSFSRDEHIYCGGTTEWHYFIQRLKQIEDMLTRLRPDTAERECQLRIAA